MQRVLLTTLVSVLVNPPSRKDTLSLTGDLGPIETNASCPRHLICPHAFLNVSSCYIFQFLQTIYNASYRYVYLTIGVLQHSPNIGVTMWSATTGGIRRMIISARSHFSCAGVEQHLMMVFEISIFSNVYP